MDVDALTKGRTKGGKDPKYEKKSPAEGKGQKNDMQCYNCGKLGHKAAECWFKRGSSTAATTTKKEGKGQKDGKKGKAAGKIGKGYLGKTVGPKGFHSFGQEEEEGAARGLEPEPEIKSLEMCSFEEIGSIEGGGPRADPRIKGESSRVEPWANWGRLAGGTAG